MEIDSVENVPTAEDDAENLETSSEGAQDDFKMPNLPLAPAFKAPQVPVIYTSKTEPPKEPVGVDSKPEVPGKVDDFVEVEENISNEIQEREEQRASKTPQKIPEIPLAYQEPSWGGIPSEKYYLEILKNGSIVETVQLGGKSFFTVGRLASCDLTMEHPSLSRNHAVLQYKTNPSPEKPKGFYLFDLDSTHGSFHNKKKCFPKTYYRLRVGHMLKFGGSTRTILLGGPVEDEEEETELTVTELKELAAEKARKKQFEEEEKRRKLEELEADLEEKEMSRGVSWGMGDDEVDEEQFPDMEKNPFAELANNESLYIDDPKKCLKNWFEREGYECPEYTVEEKGPANFYCRIDLPVDGQPNYGEAQVKGKKKEAIVQAALEACRILDRLGVLRPSQQTRMERKVKKWEEDDFYASDEDEFLDRTGDIEQKRKKRMKMAGVGGDTVETYDTLLVKLKEVEAEVKDTEAELTKALERKAKAEKRSNDGDLDNYLSELKKGAQVDKETVTKLKLRLSGLSQDKNRLIKLINIARPATMPELKEVAAKPKPGIMIGKRGSKGLLGKVKSINKDSVSKPVLAKSEQTVVLEAFLEQDEEKTRKIKFGEGEELQPIGYEVQKPTEPEKVARIGDTRCNVKKIGPEIPEHLRVTVQEKESKESDVAAIEDKENGDKKVQMDIGVATKLDDLNAGNEMETDLEETLKRNRGDRGTKRRAKKAESLHDEEESENYYKVGMDRKYDVWMPPENQSGDGKTSLNEKLGY